MRADMCGNGVRPGRGSLELPREPGVEPFIVSKVVVCGKVEFLCKVGQRSLVEESISEFQIQGSR